MDSVLNTELKEKHTNALQSALIRDIWVKVGQLSEHRERPGFTWQDFRYRLDELLELVRVRRAFEIAIRKAKKAERTPATTPVSLGNVVGIRP